MQTEYGGAGMAGTVNIILEVFWPMRYDTAHAEPDTPAGAVASETPERVALRPDDQPDLSRHTPVEAL